MIIAVDKGHTIKGIGSGAIGFVNESEWTRLIGNELIPILKNRGHVVVDVTVDYATDYMQSLYDRKNAVPQNADICLSIHLNAGGGYGDGAEILTYGGVKHPEAIQILENLEKLGFKDFKDDGTPFSRGIKNGSGLVMCTTRAKRDILVEVCFVDSKRDYELLKKVSTRDIALAIANGIDKKGVEDDMNKEQVIKIVRDEIKRMILGESQIRALIEMEVDRRVNASKYDSSGDSQNHWAEKARDGLIKKGIVIHDRRYNDLCNRGELTQMSYNIAQWVEDIMKEKGLI